MAVAAVGFLPGWSVRFARLPIGFSAPDQIARRNQHDGDRQEEEPVDFRLVADRVRRGHELLLGLVGGCAAVVIGSAGVVLGFSDVPWARTLALAVGLAVLLRARLFLYTAQVARLMAAGVPPSACSCWVSR